jgi:hypothetical protein
MEMTSQFIDAVQWSGAAFVCGVLLREYAPDQIGKWLGRSGVLVSWCVIAAFGLHSVRQCSALIQLVEFRNEAQEITDSPRVLAVASEYSATSETGARIDVTRFRDGQLRSVSLVRRRGGFDANADFRPTDSTRRTGAGVGGPDGRAGVMPYPESGVNF